MRSLSAETGRVPANPMGGVAAGMRGRRLSYRELTA
jgi:hypothetical protein